MEKQYIIPSSVLEALVQYLSVRPYQEVANGIAALRGLEEMKTEADEKKDTADAE